MHGLAADFFSRHPELSLAALGASANAQALDLKPAGVPATFLPAEEHGALVLQYRELNQLAFGALGTPSWVVSDLYLLPGAIGLLRCPARLLEDSARERLGLPDEALTVGAAYYAAPSVVSGVFIGVSLLSFVRGIRAGMWAKMLTLRMLRARRLRGVAQWHNPSVRVHTRLGPLRLVGRVPGAHEYVEQSFLYETELEDEARQVAAMERRLTVAPTMRVSVKDTAALRRLLERAEAGEVLHLVPPGLEEGHVLVREGPLE
ncbi:hypothetical protein [Hyalangium rubrum]|uniref:Uncharacterized protein n=1 Tax=Hyalangium rubrum TaxID=3103134 RepID=A0ABU5HG59_9BACT|nr:hypothetical protein [Hyalangium sp. s54d21]MDY7232346.1 hypothetical protein [Hyalangium sp. s54d21]